MMKVALATLAITGTVALAALVPDDADFTLSAIDQVPTKDQINSVLQPDPLQQLKTRATDTAMDVGIRLRAIYALGKYCSSSPCAAADLAHQSVVTVIDTIVTKQGPRTGSEVLLLRAAIETLGAMKVSSDASTLVPLLGDPSRDIRAATARALRDLCNSQAILPLRARYSAEMTDQVKLAISEALRILGQCSNP